jgi:hypothetical protein
MMIMVRLPSVSGGQTTAIEGDMALVDEPEDAEADDEEAGADLDLSPFVTMSRVRTEILPQDVQM